MKNDFYNGIYKRITKAIAFWLNTILVIDNICWFSICRVLKKVSSYFFSKRINYQNDHKKYKRNLDTFLSG